MLSLTILWPPASFCKMKNKPDISLRFLEQLSLSVLPAFQLSGDVLDLGTKDGNNPVTKVDLMASAIIIESLKDAGFSEYEILSEEAEFKEDEQSNERLWIIDPLDGTKEFLLGLPEYSVSIGYFEEGKPLAGLVFNPQNGIYIAAAGNKLDIRNTEKWKQRREMILASRSEQKRGLLERKELGLPFHCVGSVAYKLALVAANLAEATVSFQPKHSWDIAGGAALLHASGGYLTDLNGEVFDFSKPKRLFTEGLLACADRERHDLILSRCKQDCS